MKPPTDLTALAKRNGGTFPAREVMEMIDGRSAPKIGSHGTREMPVWGQIYLEQAEENQARTKLHPERTVSARIVALIDYLGQLQVK